MVKLFQTKLILLLLLLPSISEGQELSSKECENLGFTGLALCSDCNTFAEYVKNQELVSDCKKCCTEDSDDSMSKALGMVAVAVAVSTEERGGIKPTAQSLVIGTHLGLTVELFSNTLSLYPTPGPPSVVCPFPFGFPNLVHPSLITYSGAIIETCVRKLVFYPEIVGFIEEEKDQFPSLKVQYVFNSPPKLLLLDNDGQYKETIRIDNWKREHIRQFLKEKVKASSHAT
ncbi:hypothetical protein GIB67_009135 [Kingdonia uniflora]|uniref:Selenoprotein F n=1 Tax=Kingdonia uniflora TaxID=39325 RepID=A0A7J7N2V0_9MAGN|nr:hypothetical protein GIB67_009135 [Kingdonia uniflora]